jgi:hypothetical protein
LSVASAVSRQPQATGNGFTTPQRRSAKGNLDQAGFSGMLDRLALRRDILREFREHPRAQLDWVLFVERNARHTCDGVAT